LKATEESSEIFIQLNGEQKKIPAGLNLQGLLAWMEIAEDRVAIEMNKAIVRKALWPHTLVDAGAEIEIVMFVGGG
jgi:thiamine biosynthesis protein ThiS